MGEEKETKVAYNRLHLDDGSIVTGPVVVCYSADGVAINWHELAGEEAFVIWQGGDGTLHK